MNSFTMKTDFSVVIRCMTYNHVHFIGDALNGFCMQQTSFPFIAIVCDDASRDGEPEVIRNYIKEHFVTKVGEEYQTWETDEALFIFSHHQQNPNCYFLVTLLKTNYYSQRKSKEQLWQTWVNSAKYIALCEGDDYWIDPLKLQNQVDFLKTHLDYTMVCNRTKLYSEKKHKFIGENYCYNKDAIVKAKDVIYRSGLFISTCSIVYRRSIIENYPDYCRKCAVGDYPLQIMAAMKGKIYYFNEIMSVYRIQNSNSWMGMQKWQAIDDKNLSRIDSMIRMFKGFSNDFPQYKRSFSNKIAHYLIAQSPSRFTNLGRELELYTERYQDDYTHFPLFWKLIVWLGMTDIPGLRGYYVVYTRPIFNRFREKTKNYKD